MEPTPENKPKPHKPKSTMKKLDPQSIKLLATLKERANKKDFGRIELALLQKPLK